LNPYNIVWIVIDALRRDVLEHMQFLSKFSARCVVLEDAYSVTNTTDPSLTSMLSGLYPLTHGVVQHGERVEPRHLACVGAVDFIQKILKKLGYATAAVDYLGRWHRIGFDIYASPIRRVEKRTAVSTIKKLLPKRVKMLIRRVVPARTRLGLPYLAEDATELAMKIIGELEGKRFFLLVHYWDTHIPYRFSECVEHGCSFECPHAIDARYRVRDLSRWVRGEWVKKLVDTFGEATLLNAICSAYMYSAALVDREIEKLVSFLEQRKLLDNTIMIVTSDHGESLGEHGIWFDHHGLYEPSVRVPLLLHIPGMDHRRVSGFAQHVDLVPTILSVLGVKHPRPETLDGEDLTAAIEVGSTNRSLVYAEEAYTERKFMLREGRYKYIYSPTPEAALCRYCNTVHGGIEELYDMDRDPLELNNIADQQPDIAREMRKKLEAMTRDMVRKRVRIKLLSTHAKR